MSDSKLEVHRFYWVGNYYLVVENGSLTLVDTGARQHIRFISALFKFYGYNIKYLKRIVITHSHFDHAGSMAVLRKATGAKVFAHETEIPYARHEVVIPTPKGQLGVLFNIGEPFLRAARCEVDVALKEGDFVEGTGLQVIHTPGHTPGHISLYHPEAKALFSGDILLNYFGMLQGPRPFFSSDIDVGNKSLEKLINLDIQTIYFSHGMIKYGPVMEAIRRLYDSLK
jgi:glyoxylase-like metal-dependent hydrolase (beta-lactamase superfamily II)